MKTPWIVYTGAVLTLGSLPSHALADYKGAEAVLKELSSLTSEDAKPKKPANAATTLLENIQSFKTQAETLSPEAAANQWLAFYDAYVAIPQQVMYAQTGNWDTRLSIVSLLQALPPARSWDALTQKIRERNKENASLPEAALGLLGAVLDGDDKARAKAVETLDALVKAKPGMDSYQRNNLQQMIKQVSDLLIARAGSPTEQLAIFEDHLDAFEKKDETRIQQLYVLDVPELLDFVDEKKTSSYLLRVFKVKGMVAFSGEKTRKLAARLALENIDALSQPMWKLVQSTDDAALYEALLKKFPDDADENDEKSAADAVYLLNLVVQNRTEEAAKMMMQMLATSKDRSISFLGNIEELQRRGHGKAALAFLHEMLKRDPSLPLWDHYITLSAQQSASPKALALLKEVLQRPGLSEVARADAQPYYYKALLAADQVDEGIAVLKALAAGGPTETSKASAEELKKQFEKLGIPFDPDAVQGDADQYGAIRDHQQWCTQLSKIGSLLEKPELVDEGLKYLREGYAKLKTAEKAQTGYPIETIQLLVELNRGAEAEALLLEALSDQIKGRNPNSRTWDYTAKSALSALAWVYDKAGRSADVLLLLDESPMWGAPDLLHVSSSSLGTLPVIVARSLADQGKKKEAEDILSYLLSQSPGNDEVYELMLSLGGDNLEQKLDDVYNNDRFEERPLIWKAKLQLEKGDADAAEKTIRAAIAIDPSDGEQGKGDRMRAYAVLADILDKKGDKEQADIMRGAVKAIRLSEEADSWWGADLLTRAVNLYEKSLLHFADAYCIQSRLALRYSELGDLEKAELHYRRAYELMPDSFGRIESHCFGCEGAFRGKRAQNIADKVFTKLAEEQPDKAQVFYLLGYLRDAQGRSQEAADYYRKAVKIDPDYLNAWNNLAKLAGHVKMPAEERDTIAVEIFRLDPQGKHSNRSLSGMSNLRRLWEILLTTEKSLPDDAVTSLYPLPASRDDVVKHNPGADLESMYRHRNPSRRAVVRNNFTDNQVVGYTGQLIETLAQQK